MIRFMKNRIRLAHLLSVILLLSLVASFFITSAVPEASAAVAGMITNVNSECSYYKTADEAFAARDKSLDGMAGGFGGIIFVGPELNYDSGHDVYYEKPLKRYAFMTLAEAFWFIHSDTSEDGRRAMDWIFVVKGKQIFKFDDNISYNIDDTSGGNPEKDITASDLIQQSNGACVNYVDVERDISWSTNGTMQELTNKKNCSFGMYGTYRFDSYSGRKDPSGATAGYSVTGTWRKTENGGANYSYKHDGTWYITGVFGGYNFLNGTHVYTNPDKDKVGSVIHYTSGHSLYFATGGPMHFSNIRFALGTSAQGGNMILYSDCGLTIGSGVTTPSLSASNIYTMGIYGGSGSCLNGGHATRSISSSKIVVSSGNWRTITAGGDRGTITGNVKLRITGSAVVYSNVTLGFNRPVGSVDFYLDGGKVAFLYATPRTYGSTNGTTNVHLISGQLYSFSNVGITQTTKMGTVNTYIYDKVKIFNMSPTWQQGSLVVNGERNLYVVGNQSFNNTDSATYKASISGFDNVYIDNKAVVNYTGSFKSGTNLNVASGSTLYLSSYTSDDKLDDTVSLTKNGKIEYSLVQYVNQGVNISGYGFTIIRVGDDASNAFETFALVQDGLTEETAWYQLSKAYDTAKKEAVDCTFIVCGNTTESSKIAGATYGTMNGDVTIRGTNGAVLTLPVTSGFGNVTTLEDINIVIDTPADTPTASLYSGRNLIIKEGTKISTSTGVGWQINSGWVDSACNYPIKIELYTSDPQGLSLGNPIYATGGNISAVIAGDAHVGKVFFGRSPASNGDYTTTLTVNSTNAKVNSIYATPRSDDGNAVTLTGDVVINLYNGSFVEQTYDGTELASGVKCIDTNGYLNGDVTINITDEFVYTDKTIFFKSTQNPDTLINGTVTMNLAGWEGDEEFTQTDWLTYVDKLGAVTTPAGYKTNVICRQVLPTRLISDASDTSTYAVNIDAAAENQMYFHNDAYDYLKLTGSTSPATSGGTLVFGHNLVTTSAKRATALGDANKGWIEYHQCSICSNYYTSVANANSGTSCTLDSCYRYWYEVNVNTLTDDGGAGGTISATKFADDERYFSGSVTATPNTYYSFGSWSNNGLGTVNGAGYTLNIANVKNVIGKTGGTTTLTANFTRNRADLKVTKESVIHDTTQVFVYKVETPDSAALPGLTMYVTVKGNGSTVIKDLPAGEYTVTQQNDWSWRYNNRLNEVRTFTLESDHTAEFDLSKILVTINTSWLDVNSAIMKVRG